MSKHPDQNRRHALAWMAGHAALALGGAAAVAPLRAQGAWPSRPIRLIVAFGTGSGNDLIARDLAKLMGETLGQSIVVENRTGAGGSVGTDAVAKAAPDGYTIGLGTSSQLVMNPALYRKLPFDVERDLRGIGLISRTSMVLAASTAAPKTVKELVAHAKANPGKMTYGSAGIGSISHIVAEAFAKAAEIQLLHVPYKGNGPAMADLAGGHIQLLFDGFSSSNPLAAQGRIQILATSGQQRHPSNPAVPTFAEQGLPRYEATTWNCLFAPAKTPPEVIAQINAALNKAMGAAVIQQRIAQGGGEPLGPSTPEQTDAYAQAQRGQWVPFVRELKIEVE
jgi:tripartite-type tricarboxylate transporter receptor subunit TctC